VSGLGTIDAPACCNQCARELAQKTQGGFRNVRRPPESARIGRYNGAAVASIAFAEPIAVVDGNVERVVQRFLVAIERRRKSGNTRRRCLPLRPGDFNQR